MTGLRVGRVTQASPLRVKGYGDLADGPANGPAGLAVGAEVVFINLDNKRWVVYPDGGGGGLTDTERAVQLFQHSLSGGGIKTWTGTHFNWTVHFAAFGNGRGSHFGTSGGFEITRPPDGTVIPGVGGAVNQTVVAAGVPIPDFHMLYYILPIGAAYGSVAANFRIASYTSNHIVPANWVLVAHNNGSYDNEMLKLGTGEILDFWRTFTFQNGWAEYSSTYPARYKRDGSRVVMKGLIIPGTSGVFTTMPAMYRPAAGAHYFVHHGYSGSAYVSYYSYMRGAAGSPAGEFSVLHTVAAGQYVSLDQVTYEAEA